MPLLENDPELLGNFNVGSALLSMPPQGSVWSQAPTIGKVAKEAFVEGNYNAFYNLSQHALAKIGGAVGVPEWAAQGFETFFQLATKPVDPSELAKGVVAGTAQLVQTSLSQASTAVPIVGVIVQLGLYLWTIIEQALKYNDAAQRPPEQAIIYEIEGDLLNANDLKARSGHKDWTTMFLPPAESGWHLVPITWTPGGGTAGFRVDLPIRTDFGLLPGIAEQLGTYQFPQHDIGSSRPWNFYTGYLLSTTGDLLPSGRSFSTLLWQSIMKPSVPMFQVDSHAIEDAWAAYFDSLWAFGNAPRNYSDQNNETIKWGIRRACTYCKIAPTANGPSLMPVSELNEFPFDVLNESAPVNAPLTLRYTDIVRYVCRIHRARAKAALRTLVCAYVPPNAPLLQGDPVLKAYHSEMRALLLTHHARYDVELNLVPDAAYRQAVADSFILNQQIGAGLGGMGIAGGPGAEIDEGDAPPLPPGAQAPQGVTTTLPDGHRPPVPTSRIIRNVAIASGAIAAAGAGAYYFDDEIRRITARFRRR